MLLLNIGDKRDQVKARESYIQKDWVKREEKRESQKYEERGMGKLRKEDRGRESNREEKIVENRVEKR
jgi:hypothetical protein